VYLNNTFIKDPFTEFFWVDALSEIVLLEKQLLLDCRLSIAGSYVHTTLVDAQWKEQRETEASVKGWVEDF